MFSTKTGGSPMSSNSQAMSLCEEGTADLNAWRLNAAQTKLEACLELDPDLAEASISLAFTFGRLGRFPSTWKPWPGPTAWWAISRIPTRRMMAQLRLTNARESKYTSIRDSLLTRLEVEKPDNINVLVALASKQG